MGIASDITRINNGKAAIAAAIAAKGVTVPGGTKIDGMAALIASISAGLDTSDATAYAADMLSGKTAYARGAKITGNIASKGVQTYTPGTVDQTIAAGQYLSGIQTIAGDADLISANIKAGINLFGVSGAAAVVNTADATAVAADMLSGKTGYVNGAKITGSIASKGVATITPGTADQTIAAGQYLSGVQTISGDADLIAANIKSAINIFGVVGTLSGWQIASGNTTDRSAAISLGFAPKVFMAYWRRSDNTSRGSLIIWAVGIGAFFGDDGRYVQFATDTPTAAQGAWAPTTYGATSITPGTTGTTGAGTLYWVAAGY